MLQKHDWGQDTSQMIVKYRLRWTGHVARVVNKVKLSFLLEQVISSSESQ